MWVLIDPNRIFLAVNRILGVCVTILMTLNTRIGPYVAMFGTAKKIVTSTWFRWYG